jgi:hypothetical protein
MNFIGKAESAEIQVELKYCERCGGLWLRRLGADGVYCGGCRARLADMRHVEEAPLPNARQGKGGARGVKVSRESLQRPGRIEYLQGVAAVEVRA